MYHPTIFFDPQFTVGVMAGWLLQAGQTIRPDGAIRVQPR